MRVFFSIGCILLTIKLLSQTDTIFLKEIEINSNRVSTAYNKELRVVQVINNEELKKMPASSLSDILDYFGSIDVRQRGVHSVQSDVSIRGGNYEQVLLMINGIPVNDPQTGHHNMNIPIDIKMIERIEILSGGDARRYGANAFTGAINLVTKVKLDNKFSLSGGDFKYFSGQTIGCFKLLNTQQIIALNRHQSNGYRKNTDFNHNQIMWQAFYKTENQQLQALVAAENKSFGANSFYTPKFPDQYEQTRALLASLNNKLYFQKSTLILQAYYRQHHDRFELFRHDLPSSVIPVWYKSHNYHMTQVSGAQSNYSFNTKAGKTTLGIDYRYEQILSNVLGESINDTIKAPFEKNGIFTKKANKSYWSIFSDHSKKFNNMYFSGGLMVTFLSNKQLYYYPGIDFGYYLNSNITFFSSVSRSLRLPTYTELYYKDPAHTGNIDLMPEEALNYEIGIKFFEKYLHVQTAYFIRKGKNIIDWVRLSSNEKWKSQNITTVNTSGFELSINYKHKLIKPSSLLQQIHLNYSYINITKQSGNYYSKYALDVLRNKVSLIIDHQIINNLKASWVVLYHERMGTFTEFPTNIEKKYKPYITLDGKIVYTYKNTELYISGSNLFDAYYYDIANIPMPGRWVIGGIKIFI